MKFFLLLLFIFFYFYPALAIDTKAEQAIVLDLNTNEVLYEKNADHITPPASMTKILTVYLVFDRLKNTSLSMEDTCNVSARAYRMRGSKMFIEIDTKVSIKDLLRGIIIQSGNDASVAIAECLSGTEEDFANLMNIYAEKFQMKNSNFINSSGWPEQNHYSTVRDLSIISKFIIIDFPDLYKLFSEKEFTYNGIKQPNRNKLLINVAGGDGLKTGFTKNSGWGIAASAINDGRRIIVVINGTSSSRSRLNESSNLLNWAMRETKLQKILKKNQIIKEVDIWLGNKSTVNLIVQKDIITTLSFEQSKLIKSNIEYKKPLPAPFKKGDVVGKMTINISGKPAMIVPLVAETNVNSINPLVKVFAAAKYLIFGTSLDE